MSEVIVRQWGPDCYAAYVNRGEQYPDFVGTESTREDADRLGQSCCTATPFGGTWDASEHVSMGQLGDARRERVNAQTAGLDPILITQEAGPTVTISRTSDNPARPGAT